MRDLFSDRIAPTGVGDYDRRISEHTHRSHTMTERTRVMTKHECAEDICREWAKEQAEQKPIDGHPDSPRQLPCWPRAYDDTTPTHTDEHPNFGTVIGAIVVVGFFAAMLASAAAIVREVGAM